MVPENRAKDFASRWYYGEWSSIEQVNRVEDVPVESNDFYALRVIISYYFEIFCDK